MTAQNVSTANGQVVTNDAQKKVDENAPGGVVGGPDSKPPSVTAPDIHKVIEPDASQTEKSASVASAQAEIAVSSNLHDLEKSANAVEDSTTVDSITSSVSSSTAPSAIPPVANAAVSTTPATATQLVPVQQESVSSTLTAVTASTSMSNVVNSVASVTTPSSAIKTVTSSLSAIVSKSSVASSSNATLVTTQKVTSGTLSPSVATRAATKVSAMANKVTSPKKLSSTGSLVGDICPSEVIKAAAIPESEANAQATVSAVSTPPVVVSSTSTAALLTKNTESHGEAAIDTSGSIPFAAGSTETSDSSCSPTAMPTSEVDKAPETMDVDNPSSHVKDHAPRGYSEASDQANNADSSTEGVSEHSTSDATTAETSSPSVINKT